MIIQNKTWWWQTFSDGFNGSPLFFWLGIRINIWRWFISRPTFHCFGVGLTAALTHVVEELVHLLQWERVVQRLQRVDRGHHGAAFKPCSTNRRDRNTAGRTTSPSDEEEEEEEEKGEEWWCYSYLCMLTTLQVSDKQVLTSGSRIVLLTSHTDFNATLTS